MIDDPIVEEVRDTRQRIFEQCGGDLEQLMEHLKASESRDRDRLVTMDDLCKSRQAEDGRESELQK